jgi:glycosyl transferase family 87
MRRHAWAVLAAGALVLAVYVLRLDYIVGIMGDDAWYALLGRTLSLGGGFLQPNTPTPGQLPYLPPGFALLLAPLWYIAPVFPTNVLVLKALSVAAMFATAGLTYAYCRAHREWPRQLSLIVAVVVALVPSLVFLTTSTLMSDCVFLAVQLATLVALERWPTRTGTVVAGVGAAVAMLMRAVGVTVPVGAVVYLCLTRQWRRAAMLTAVVVVSLTPWQIYASRHAPTDAQMGNGETLLSYRRVFWQQWAGDTKAGTATYRDLPPRIGRNMIDVVARDSVALVAPSLLRGAHQSGLEVLGVGSYGMQGPMGNGAATMTVSAVLFLLMAVGWVRAVQRQLSLAEIVVPLSLVLIVSWPFWTFRFVLPLAPFLLVYLVDGLRAVTPAASPVPVLAMLGVAGLSLFDHGEYLVRARVRQPDWSVYAEDTGAVLAWLQQHPTDGVIATSNPALVYLRTGTPTIQLEGFVDRAVLKARGVRYVVWVHLASMRVPVDQGAVRYVSPRTGFWVLEL